MGKRKKRMLKKKYAKKYATKRNTLGFTGRKVINGVVTIDMTTSEEIKEEEQVQVVVNEPVVEEKEGAPPWDAEPELELIQVEEPEVKVETPPPPKKKTTRRKKSTMTKTTTAKKKTTTRKAPTRRRTAKKTEE